MLKRLLDEFSDVAIAAQGADPLALAAFAGRMHKLRGSAGILGAQAIHIVAGEAEAACLAGEVERASRLSTELAIQLQRLQQTAAPTLMAALAADEEEAPNSEEELEPQVLADFVSLLRRQSLSAMDRFSSLSPQLRRLLGRSSYALVRGHMDNLQFGSAANALEASQRSTAPR
jgi:HPt (histidine-containing phosphotransfer) domain-containing protein